MAESFESKLDKIAEDTAYFRGKWDGTMPGIVKLLETHGTQIGQLEKSQENMKVKVGIAGSVAGAAMSAFIGWFNKHMS